MPKAAKDKNGASPLDQIKALYQFMVEKGLASIEFGQKDFHVRLVRQGAYAAPLSVKGAAPAEAGAAPAPAAAGPAVPPGAEAVKSPMMGIFYRAPSPSSPPFVRDGDMMKKGQVICMIEAMKVFNEIRADFDCKVLKVLVENGKPVRAGQEIFAVERL